MNQIEVNDREDCLGFGGRIWGLGHPVDSCKIWASAGGRPRQSKSGITQGHPMKYATLALLGIGLAIGSSLASGQAPTAKAEPELKTVEQRFAYSIGLDMGKRIKAADVGLDPDIIAKGIKDALADKAMLTDKQIAEVQKAFNDMMATRPDKNTKEGQAFLAANKDKPGVKTTASGLQYKVLKSGTGKTPKATDTFVAHYKGTLIDGTEFDSSYGKKPLELPVTRVIPGWTEALQLMKVGDKWQLFIPSNLAYGPRPMGDLITPNSTLIFEMELLDVK
jgi:FKBP-type peptidyl-prolyl cis-trans isomerase FklB